MAFLNYFIIIVISVHNCLARPTSDNAISEADQASKEQLYVFPTNVKPGFELNAKGILNTSDSQFQVTLPNKEDTSTADCILIFDIQENNKIVLTSSKNSFSEEVSYTSSLGQNVKFNVTIKARKAKTGNLLTFHFATNDDGVSDLLDCPVEDFNNLNSILFTQGSTKINMLKFNFSNEYYQA